MSTGPPKASSELRSLHRGRGIGKDGVNPYQSAHVPARPSWPTQVGSRWAITDPNMQVRRLAVAAWIPSGDATAPAHRRWRRASCRDLGSWSPAESLARSLKLQSPTTLEARRVPGRRRPDLRSRDRRLIVPYHRWRCTATSASRSSWPRSHSSPTLAWGTRPRRRLDRACWERPSRAISTSRMSRPATCTGTTLLRHIGCTASAHEEAAHVGGDEMALRPMAARSDFRSPRESVAFMMAALKAVHPARRPALLASSFGPWGKRAITATCEVAATMANRLGLAPEVRSGLFDVFERWDGKGTPRGLAGEDVTRAARIAQVATSAVAFDRLGGVDLAVDVVRHRAGRMLDPEVAAAFPGPRCRDAHRNRRRRSTAGGSGSGAAAGPVDKSAPPRHVRTRVRRHGRPQDAPSRTATLRPWRTSPSAPRASSPSVRTRWCSFDGLPCCTTSAEYRYPTACGRSAARSPRGNGKASASTLTTRSGSWRGRRRSSPWRLSQACTTSASMAAATIVARRLRRSRCPRDSSLPPTFTRR